MSLSKDDIDKMTVKTQGKEQHIDENDQVVYGKVIDQLRTAFRTVPRTNCWWTSSTYTFAWSTFSLQLRVLVTDAAATFSMFTPVTKGKGLMAVLFLGKGLVNL